MDGIIHRYTMKGADRRSANNKLRIEIVIRAGTEEANMIMIMKGRVTVIRTRNGMDRMMLEMMGLGDGIRSMEIIGTTITKVEDGEVGVEIDTGTGIGGRIDATLSQKCLLAQGLDG